MPITRMWCRGSCGEGMVRTRCVGRLWAGGEELDGKGGLRVETPGVWRLQSGEKKRWKRTIFHGSACWKVYGPRVRQPGSKVRANRWEDIFPQHLRAALLSSCSQKRAAEIHGWKTFHELLVTKAQLIPMAQETSNFRLPEAAEVCLGRCPSTWCVPYIWLHVPAKRSSGGFSPAIPVSVVFLSFQISSF